MTIRTGSRRDDLRESIEMFVEGLAVQMQESGTQDPAMVAQLAAWEAELADLVARGADVPGDAVADGEGVGTPRALTSRPAAGSDASNQYGTFTVRYASEKQTRYIGFLMESRDLTNVNSDAFRVRLDVEELRRQVAANEVNKRAASDIIDRLLSCPEKTAPAAAAPAPTGRPASEKQIAFIRKLVGEKMLSGEDVDKILAGLDRLSTKGASATIEKLLALPTATPREIKTNFQVEAGVYVNSDGKTFRVYLGQQSGRLLAALAVEYVDEDGHAKARFEYQGQADRYVTATSRKLTIEEAARFGKATGTCIVCARRLDVPESVDRGIGPVCYAKMGG